MPVRWRATAYTLRTAAFPTTAEKKELKVSPAKGGDDFQCFVTTSQGWGVFRRRKTKEGVKCELTSLYGDMSDIKIIENEEDEK